MISFSLHSGLRVDTLNSRKCPVGIQRPHGQCHIFPFKKAPTNTFLALRLHIFKAPLNAKGRPHEPKCLCIPYIPFIIILNAKVSLSGAYLSPYVVTRETLQHCSKEEIQTFPGAFLAASIYMYIYMN